MSKRWRWVVVVSVLAGGAARAADPTPGFGASVRLGFGNPLGSTSGTWGDLSSTFGGQVPIQVDLGYRVTPELVLAAYGQWAFGSVPVAACGGGSVSCSASDLRIGIEALWHFLPGHVVDPWMGAGLGWERATVAAPANGAMIDVTLSGFELANAQAGADFAIAPGFSAGPFVQLTFASYSSASASRSGLSASLDVQEIRMHEWLQLGIRGSFNL